MSAINTGGPAFPVSEEAIQRNMTGASLRDYFAAKAMQGYLSSFHPHDEPVEYAMRIAEDSYALADAMLAARGKGGAA